MSPKIHYTAGERLALRWPLLRHFVAHWCHERYPPCPLGGGECRLRRNHSGPHLNFAGDVWRDGEYADFVDGDSPAAALARFAVRARGDEAEFINARVEPESWREL